MLNKKVLNVLLSMSLSANAMVIVTWIFTNALGYQFISPNYLFKSMIAGAVIAGVSTAFEWVYQRSNNLFITAGLHFLTTAIIFVLCGLWAQWFPMNIGVLVTAFSIFIVVFLTLWLCYYLYWKNEIKKINNKLEK